MEEMYITVRVCYTRVEDKGQTQEDIAMRVCNDASAFLHVIEEGVQIDEVDFCGINE